ncbi:MAG: hypothetical protein QNL93_05775, partial [Opitutae bacterium]
MIPVLAPIKHQRLDTSNKIDQPEKEFSLDQPKPRGQARRPLAERMRSRSIAEVLGQDHILGKG